MDTANTIRYDPAADYYRALGVPPTASQEEIRRAYRQNAKRVHPDHNRHRQAWAHKQSQQLNHIKDVLSDPALKAEYDRQRTLYLLSLFGEPQTQAQVWQPEQPQDQTRANVGRYQYRRPQPSKRFANLLIVVGCMVITAGLSLWIALMTDVQNSPPLSQSFTFDEIIAMNGLPSVASVKLIGLDCASLKANDDKSMGYLLSGDQRTLAVIAFSSVRTCPQAERGSVAGSIQPLDGGMYRKLVTEGAFLDYPEATNFIYICENCGGSSPTAVTGMAAIISLAGLYAVWLGLSKLRLARKIG